MIPSTGIYLYPGVKQRLHKSITPIRQLLQRFRMNTIASLLCSLVIHLGKLRPARMNSLNFVFEFSTELEVNDWFGRELNS